MEQPLVSVIIPTYSRPDNIVRAIDSVLAQTYKNIEIIVVDDNGQGTQFQIETENVLSDYISKGKIIYIKHDVNKNGSAARNTGFRACHGQYVNFLDDDDVFMPEKIEKQIEQLECNPEYGATYCNTKKREKRTFPNKIYYTISHNNQKGNVLKEYLTGRCQFNTSAILFRYTVVSSLNGFDESWRRHQDFEIMVRFFRNNIIMCTCDEPLLLYDLTIDRINVPNASKQFSLEERFLLNFKRDLDTINAYREVSYYLWMDCLINSLRSSDKVYVKKTLGKLLEIRIFHSKDFAKIVKSVLRYYLIK